MIRIGVFRMSAVTAASRRPGQVQANLTPRPACCGWEGQNALAITTEPDRASERLGGCVRHQHGAASKRLYADESKIDTAIQILEEALTGFHDDGMKEYPILVDEPGVRQRLHEPGTAERN